MRDLAVIDAAAQGGEWTAAAWRLERKFPHKWGRQAKVQVEHSGPGGSPIELVSRIDQLKKVLSDPDALNAIETLEAKLKDESDKDSSD